MASGIAALEVQNITTNPSQTVTFISSKTCCGNEDEEDELSDPHLDTYRTFARDLDKAAEKIVRQKPRYERVVARLAWWEESISDRKHLATDAENLLAVFRNQYNFDSEHLKLEEDTAEEQLQDEFSELRKSFRQTSKTKRGLFILYYGGHAYYKGNDRQKPYLRPTGGDGTSVEVNWGPVQWNLTTMDCDILFIFDCCYALGMVVRDWKWGGTVEILGAAAEGKKAGGEAGCSFTQAMTELLADEAKMHGGATTWRLATVMINPTWWKNDKKLLVEPKFTKVKRSPQDVSTIPSRFDSFILLVPLEKIGDDASSGLSTSTLAEPIPITSTRVLFKISFTSAPDLEEWIRWLENRPTGIHGIRIAAHKNSDLDKLRIKCHSLFESGSNLAIMSMPMWLWYAMPQNEAYQKIGTIYSDDLMPRSVSHSQIVASSEDVSRIIESHIHERTNTQNEVPPPSAPFRMLSLHSPKPTFLTPWEPSKRRSNKLYGSKVPYDTINSKIGASGPSLEALQGRINRRLNSYGL
ncbi:hypothetical protein ACMFMG_010131 [Clarireedia jacksonii]